MCVCVCVRVCVCVCVCVCLKITSTKFDIGHCLVKLKVTAGVSISSLECRRKLKLSMCVYLRFIRIKKTYFTVA